MRSAALLHECVRQAPEPRSEDQREPTDDHDDGDQSLSECRERTLGREERRHSAHDQGGADHDTADGRRVTLHSITRGGWPLPADELADQLVDGAAAAPDDQCGAHRREHEWPDDRVGNPKPDRLRQQQHAEYHGTERGNLHPVGAALTSGARDRRGGAVVFGKPQPACEVQDNPGPTREREHHEREAHQVRFDLESVADPAGDTGDELVVRPTRQARVRSRWASW